MSAVIVSANGDGAAATGQLEFFPGAKLSREARLTYGGIQYAIEAAPNCWQLHDEWSYCADCGEPLIAIAPCCLHSLPLMRCCCGSAAFLTPLDEEACGLLELQYPVSDRDKAIGERFRRELCRLGAPDSFKQEAK
jgi:hypothetical protein